MGQSRVALSDADVRRFSDLVRARSGLVIPDVRRADLERAVAQAQDEHGTRDAASLYSLLVDPDLGRVALESFTASLTVGETHFFRNRAQMDALESHILPDIINRRRAQRRLRIWSAGCASGEEPYSIAMLLERILPDLASWDIHLLGTDIAGHALEKARRGVYSQWSFRDVPSDVVDRWFVSRGREREVLPRIRDRVTLSYLNLVEDPYPSLLTDTVALDLVLCRNVLIYFDAATVQRVVGRLRESLAPGGWLVVGHSEPSQTVFTGLARRSFPGAVAYQLEEPAQPEVRLTPPARVTPAPTRVELPPPAETPAPEEPLGDDAYVAARLSAGRLQFEDAERWTAELLQNDPLHVPGRYLHALLMQEQGNLDEALAALRRCVFVDPSFVLGHYALAGVFQRLGQWARARKSLDNASGLLAGLARDEAVPEGEGLTVGRLSELVALQRDLLPE